MRAGESLIVFLRRKPQEETKEQIEARLFPITKRLHGAAQPKGVDRKNAQKIANDNGKAATARTTGARAGRVIREIDERVTGRELPSKTVSAFLPGWLATKKVQLAPSSYDASKAPA